MNRIRADTKSYCLYVHITPTNKKYFGVTSQKPQVRFGNNGSGYKRCTLFYRAIQKYGWENIKHIVLIDNLSKEWAESLEKLYISMYDTTNPKNGYNLTLGGEGILGYKLSEEQIERCRINSTGHKHTLETRQLMSQKQKGRIVSDETRKKLSLSHKGKPAHNKGIPMSDEAKHKISVSKRGQKCHTQPHSEETKRKISEHSKGRVVSLETREKLRQKALEQWKKKKLEKGD